MKKSLFFVCVALLLASCNELATEDSELLIGSKSPENVMSFSAYSDEGSVSKAKINTNHSITWEEGDAISVFDVNTSPANTKFELVEGVDETSGKFLSESAVASETGYYALYPYSSSAALSGSTITGVEIPLEQRLRASGQHNDVTASKMAAYTEEDSFSFKNVCAYIKFYVGTFGTETVKEVKFTSNGDESLVGTFNVSFTDGLPVISDVDGLGMVSLKPVGDSFELGTYYIAVIPQKLKDGFTITFATNEKRYWETTTKEVTLKRGYILDLGDFSSISISHSAAETALFGNGTFEDPFRIASYSNLRYLADRFVDKYSTYSSGYYRQVRDIDFNYEPFYTIGSSSNSFKGTYDGGGHRIDNVGKFYSDGRIGIFAACADAEFDNMIVNLSQDDDHSHNLTYSYNAYGGIVGVVKQGSKSTLFSNCVVEGSAKFKANGSLYMGGFVGDINGRTKFQNCTNKATIRGINMDEYSSYDIGVGGFIGHISIDSEDSWIKIDRCRNLGSIDAESSSSNGFVGGFIGREYESSTTDDITLQMYNCANKGAITIKSFQAGRYSYDRSVYAGGLIGTHNSDGAGLGDDPLVYNCVNTGTVTAKDANDSFAGGLMGYCYDGDTHIRVCANYATIVATASDDAVKAAFIAEDGTVWSSLDIKYCLIKSGIQMTDGDNASEYSGCKSMDHIKASDMNALRNSNLDYAYILYWKGEDSTLDIDF